MKVSDLDNEVGRFAFYGYCNLAVKYPTASRGVFDPRGIRQMQEKSIPAPGSLPAGIKEYQ